MGLWKTFLDGFAVLNEMRIVVAGAVILVCVGCGIYFFQTQKTVSRKELLLPGFFLAISLILHLAFLRNLFVPPYFDSVEHYRIVKNLTTTLETSSLLETLPTLTPTYYHLGFHVLASLLALGLHADPMDAILVLGQVILAAIPLPVYVLVWRETASARAALFAMLLAGFGWYMPGFGVNWGKYPALAGLLVLEIALGIAYGIAQGKQKRRSFIPGVFLFLTIIVTALFHTRTLIIIVLSLVTWKISGELRAAPKMFQHASLVLLFGAIIVLGASSQADALLTLVLDPYLGAGLWVTLAVFVLSPFAFFHFPRGFYFDLLLITGMMVALFMPVGIPATPFANQTLLDRPFVEMSLYLPLSFLGGLGMAGLFKSLNNIHSFSKRKVLFSRIFTALLLPSFAGLLLETYNFYPSDCCNFVRYDDTVALDWLDKNLPADAHILVAGTTLNVLPTGPSPGLVGTDAGVWIPNMTGRHIRLASFDTDFGSENTLREMCQMQIEYVYIGSTVQSFNFAQLGKKTEWYEKILLLPNAQLFELKGCTKT